MNSPATTLSGTDSHGSTKPSSSDSMPRNMMGPRTNPPATLAGTLTSEAEPNVSIETGAVDETGGRGDADLLGQRPGQEAEQRA